MRTAAGLVDHPVDDVEIAPAALFIMGSPPHQPVADRRGALLGKVVLQQLHHRRQPLADLAVG